MIENLEDLPLFLLSFDFRHINLYILSAISIIVHSHLTQPWMKAKLVVNKGSSSDAPEIGIKTY